MNKILLPVLLAFCTAGAFAQSGTVTTTDDKGKVEATTVVQTPDEKSADAFCLRETGSHLLKVKNDRNGGTVECAIAPGRAYTREEIDRTGATTVGGALRDLDPSIQIRHPY